MDFKTTLCLFAIVHVLHFAEVRGQLQWLQLHNGSHGDLGNVTVTVPPLRRDAVLAYDEARKQLVLFGGMPGPKDDTWIYNLTTNEWREVNATVRPPARHGAVGGVADNYFYIATGRGDDNKYYNDVWRFDLRNETWELLPSSPEEPVFQDMGQTNETEYVSNEAPAGRYSAAGGIYVKGTRIYVTMGTSTRRMDDMYYYDVTSNTWYKESGECGLYDPRCPHRRYLQSFLMTGRDEFVIFSGCLTGGGAAGPCPSSDTWRYDGRSQAWTRLSGCPAPRLYGSMAMLTRGGGRRLAVLYGGQTDAHTIIEASEIADDEVAILDVDNGTWTIRRTAKVENGTGIPVLRVSAAMATGPDGVFLFGGSSSHEVYANDLWLLRGNATDADLAPTLPCPRITITLTTIHGILMTIGFGFLLPLGALFARYVGNVPGHVAAQILGLCCSVAGLAVIVVSVKTDHFSVVHAYVGIVALGLGVLQPFNAICRPRTVPEEQKGLSHRIWESVHRFGGRAALLLGLANISLGIFMALADLPIIAAWHGWLGFLLLIVIVIELVRCFSRMRRKSMSPRMLQLQSDGSIINGWEKASDGSYINATTESVRL